MKAFLYGFPAWTIIFNAKSSLNLWKNVIIFKQKNLLYIQNYYVSKTNNFIFKWKTKLQIKKIYFLKIPFIINNTYQISKNDLKLNYWNLRIFFIA